MMPEYNVIDPETGFYKVGTIINKKLPGYDPAKLNQRITPHGFSQYGVSRDETYEVVDPNYSGGGGFLGLNKIIDPVAEPIVDAGKVVMPLIVGGGLGAGALGLLGAGGAGAAGAGGAYETALASSLAAEGAGTGIGAGIAEGAYGTGLAGATGVGGLTAEEIAAAKTLGTGLDVGEAGAVAGTVADTATKTKLAADIVSGASSAWSLKNKLLAASLGLTAATTIAAALDSGDKETSATTTTKVEGPGDNKVPGTDVTAKEKSFEDFLTDFYKLDPASLTASVKDRIAQDQTALQGYQKTLLDTLGGLDTKRLSDTTAELTPYRGQLTQQLSDSQGGTGLYKPINLSFGGNPITSFVPKQNLAQARGQLDLGRENASIGTGLIDQSYKAGTDQAGREFGFNSENLPNKAANTYSTKLEELMKYFNPNGQTSTTTGSVPGTPWYTAALQGLNTSVNLWDKIENPRQSNTDALLAALFKQNAGG
jgi:hypothetical protein